MRKMTWSLILIAFLGGILAGAPPTITILAPTGGENWVLGTQHGIAWTTIKGHSGTAYINLWGYNAANQLIHLGPIAQVNYQAGGYFWKVGQLMNRKVGPGRYYIRIVALCPSLPKMQTMNQNSFRLHAFSLPMAVQPNG
ncbi:MAG TPA: hypothetical protein PK919_07120 [Candidatus Aminicenantes bacterium]|nr:hypothetical protein [Candidatus Aminicenantes bacterium]